MPEVKELSWGGWEGAEGVRPHVAETPSGVALIQIIYIWLCNAWYDVSVADLPF